MTERRSIIQEAIPGVRALAAVGDANTRREQAARRNSPAGQALAQRQAAEIRLQRLDRLMAQAVQDGNQLDIDALGPLIAELRPAPAPTNGMTAGAINRGLRPEIAARRNAFAGMGAR